MRKGILRLSAVVALALLVCAGAPAAADRALPLFNVADAAGAAVPSTDLAQGNNWILIYTRVACEPCAQLLNVLKIDDPPAWTARIRVVAGGATPEGLAAMQQQFPQLTGASWYADADGSVARALSLSGAPAVFGMRDRAIAWTSQGSLPISRTLIAGWVNQ